MTRPTPDDLRRLWNLTRMPTETVDFLQTYIDPKQGPDGKPLCTATVALLDVDACSEMHALPTDEIWHFYLGDPIELLLLYPDGRDELVILGQDVLAGERVQTVVPAGTIMGARLRPGGDFGVYGNTMAPGFAISDFEPLDLADALRRWPHRRDLIVAMVPQGEE
ncbi:hypothetical protein ASG80_00830 [Agromyces sp. Soil535]|nr:hypothetical protein ASG80_00830 [Agromyces sp. Soil535]